MDFSFTHVSHRADDAVLGPIACILSLSHLIVPLLLLSQFLSRRDLLTLFALAGVVVNEAVNKVLKRTIDQRRPAGSPRAEPGMPSAHAQFSLYLAVFYSIWVFDRLCPRGGCSTALRAASSAAMLATAAAVSYSRVYLDYHTAPQVLVGAAIGASFAVFWYAVVGRSLMFTRGFAAIESHRWAKLLRMRDLGKVNNVLDRELAIQNKN